MVVKCCSWLCVLGHHFPELLSESDTISSISNGALTKQCEQCCRVRKPGVKEWETRQNVCIDPLSGIHSLPRSPCQGQLCPLRLPAQLLQEYTRAHISSHFRKQSNEPWVWWKTQAFDLFLFFSAQSIITTLSYLLSSKSLQQKSSTLLLLSFFLNLPSS